MDPPSPDVYPPPPPDEYMTDILTPFSVMVIVTMDGRSISLVIIVLDANEPCRFKWPLPKHYSKGQ